MNKTIVIFVSYLLFLIPLEIQAQHEVEYQINNNGDTIRRFESTFKDGWLFEEKTFLRTVLEEHVVLNTTKDTVIKSVYRANGKSGEAIFYIRDTMYTPFVGLYENFYARYYFAEKAYDDKGRLSSISYYRYFNYKDGLETYYTFDYVEYYNSKGKLLCKDKYTYDLKGKLVKKKECEK